MPKERRPAEPDNAAVDPVPVGDWQLHAASDELARGAERLKIEPRLTRLLQALVRADGAVVTQQALLDEVWRGLVVTPDSVYQSVAKLRRLLDPLPGGGSHIETVARRGYRLNPRLRALAPAAPRRVPDLGPLSIAVLPFETAGRGRQADLAAALLDLVIARLARDHRLTVIARGTVGMLSPRPQDVRTVAADLGVHFVATGRMALADGRVQISFELADGASGSHAAGDAVDADAVAWQAAADDVASRIARGLDLEIKREAVRRALREPSQAEALALRAWVELFLRPQTRATNERAGAWAAQAIALDTEHAGAYTCLAYSEWRAAQFAWDPAPRPMLLQRAHDHVQRALVLDARDADAHYTLGLLSHFLDAPLQAEEALWSCLRLNPSYAPAYGILGIVRTTLGRPEEALPLCARAFAISPREPLRAIWHSVRAYALLALDRNDEALVQAQSGIVANADYPFNYAVGIAAAHRLGRTEIVQRWKRLLQPRPYGTLSALVERVPQVRTAPFGPRFIADLRAAGVAK